MNAILNDTIVRSGHQQGAYGHAIVTYALSEAYGRLISNIQTDLWED